MSDRDRFGGRRWRTALPFLFLASFAKGGALTWDGGSLSCGNENLRKSAQTTAAKTDKTSSGQGFVSFVSAAFERFAKICLRFCRFCQCLARGFPKTRHTPVTSESSPEDWDAFFHERAGIREFDGGLRRTDAEAFALQDTIAALGPRPAIGWR